MPYPVGGNVRRTSRRDIATLQARRAGVRQDPRWDPSLATGAAFAVMLVWAAALTQFRPQLPMTAVLAVTTSVVAVFAWCSTWPCALATAGLGWLMANGFGSNRDGALRWNGAADGTRLAILFACAAAAAGARSVQLSRRRALELAAAGFDEDLSGRVTLPATRRIPSQRASRSRGERHA